ncbi:MAG: ribokinase [Acidobacteria bacterium]|nr:ribokinase [Acidobacteriota bacterium]
MRTFPKFFPLKSGADLTDMNFPFHLPENKTFDVVGFGTNAVDFLIQVPAYPQFDSKVRLVDYAQAAGGEVATTMAGLQRLGLRTSYVGRFGDDPPGDIGFDSLKNEGVDLSFAERIANCRTQIAFIVIDVRNGERTVIWDRDQKLGYAAGDVPLAAVADAKVLHLTPHDTEACVRLARSARENGVIVSTDIDRRFDGIEELLPLVDILLASADFPPSITGRADHKDALKALKDTFGCAITGVTLGDRGSLVLGPDGFIETPAFAVPGGCKDTTGAGDSFRVGFLYGLLTGASIEESCRMANGVAALKCRAVGARTALPDARTLQLLLDENR